MEEEAADELVGSQGDHFWLAGMAIVFPAETDTVVGEGEQTAVGDGDAVGVASEGGEHLLEAAEWGFGIDDPVGAAQWGKAAGEGIGVVEGSQIGEEGERAGVESGLEAIEEQPAEEPGEDAHGQEKARTASHPTGAV